MTVPPHLSSYHFPTEWSTQTATSDFNFVYNPHLEEAKYGGLAEEQAPSQNSIPQHKSHLANSGSYPRPESQAQTQNQNHYLAIKDAQKAEERQKKIEKKARQEETKKMCWEHKIEELKYAIEKGFEKDRRRDAIKKEKKILKERAMAEQKGLGRKFLFWVKC